MPAALHSLGVTRVCVWAKGPRAFMLAFPLQGCLCHTPVPAQDFGPNRNHNRNDVSSVFIPGQQLCPCTLCFVSFSPCTFHPLDGGLTSPLCT